MSIIPFIISFVCYFALVGQSSVRLIHAIKDNASDTVLFWYVICVAIPLILLVDQLLQIRNKYD